MTNVAERENDEVVMGLVPDAEIKLGLSSVSALSFKRTHTGTVEMYIDNVLVNVLERDEWEWFWEGLGRL